MAEWDDDVTKILLEAPALPEGVPEASGWLRDLMVQAWQFGYTTGMQDSATLEGSLTAALERMEVRARALQAEMGAGGRRRRPGWFGRW